MIRSAAALALALAMHAGGAAAQPAPDAPAEAWRATTLEVSASGEVKAAPDMASVTIGVQTQAPTASAAMADNATRMNRLLAALRGRGVEAKDIQTSGLNLQPQYAYGQNEPPRLTGYQAADQVTVIVSDLSRLGATLDAVVSAGANQVNGVSFGLKDPKAAEDAARLKAVQALQAKAQLYASAAGYRIVRLVRLSEGSASAPPRPMFAARAMAAQATPIEPGQLDIEAQVSGVFELGR